MQGALLAVALAALAGNATAVAVPTSSHRSEPHPRKLLDPHALELAPPGEETPPEASGGGEGEAELSLHAGGEHGEHGEHVEHGEHGEEGGGSIFTMPEGAFSGSTMLMMLMALIFVTVLYEQVTEHLEEKVFKEGMGAKLLAKMVKELAILGFVSFTSTVLLQLKVLPFSHEQHEFFEFAHVLLFATAVVYAKEIALISGQVDRLVRSYKELDEFDYHKVLELDRQTHPSSFNPSVLRAKAAWGTLRATVKLGMFQRDTTPPMAEASVKELQSVPWWKHDPTKPPIALLATYKVLKFHFLGYQGLLGSKKFQFSEYLRRSLDKHIDDMVDLKIGTWWILFGLVGVAAPVHHVMPVWAFPLFSLAVLGGQKVLHLLTQAKLNRLMRQGYKIRNLNKPHSVLMEKELEAARQLELFECINAYRNPALMQLTAADMRSRRAENEHLEKAFAEDNARYLKYLEHFLQVEMMLSCMVQSFIVMHLARLFIEKHGWVVGTIQIALTYLPCHVMSFFMTPKVLQEFALSHAIAMKHEDVLQDMEREAEQTGDYVGANEVLEMAMTHKLSEDEMRDEEAVRQKVRDLNKLGELRWRFRVVDEGQNPRDSAIEVLEEALSLIARHKELTVGPGADARKALAFDRMWAAEKSEASQGLALSRLIFNSGRDEDDLIEELLQEALRLRVEMKASYKIADTLNSLGSLRQKQQKYAEAEANYAKSLGVRKKVRPQDEKEEKEQAQMLAQSYVSIGNLKIEMQEYKEALPMLEQAKLKYEEGFAPGHPKVAWALEAIGKCHRKIGNLKKSQEALDEALMIRCKLMEGAEGKELFAKEVANTKKIMAEVESRRAQIGQLNQKSFKKAVALNRLNAGALKKAASVASSCQPSAAPPPPPPVRSAATASPPAAAAAAPPPPAAAPPPAPPRKPKAEPTCASATAPPAASKPAAEYIEQARAAVGTATARPVGSGPPEEELDIPPFMRPIVKNLDRLMKQLSCSFTRQ